MRKILIYNFSYLFFHQKLFFMKYVAFFLKPIGLPEIELYRWSIIYFFKNGIGLSTIQTTRYFSPEWNFWEVLNSSLKFVKMTRTGTGTTICLIWQWRWRSWILLWNIQKKKSLTQMSPELDYLQIKARDIHLHLLNQHSPILYHKNSEN